MLRFLTAGESHGPGLTVIVEGLPAAVPVDRAAIDADLRRRQGGYGRGGRMKIEKDTVEIVSGVRHGRTLGSPVSFVVRNRDHENWADVMSPDPQPDEARQRRRLHHPRPGHADLAGALKYDTTDLRNVLERASARETTVSRRSSGMTNCLRKASILSPSLPSPGSSSSSRRHAATNSSPEWTGGSTSNSSRVSSLSVIDSPDRRRTTASVATTCLIRKSRRAEGALSSSRALSPRARSRSWAR